MWEVEPLVPLLAAALWYVGVAPQLDHGRPTVRAITATLAIGLISRYLWWRWTATIVPIPPASTTQYAWVLLFGVAESALAIEAVVFYLLMSRRRDRRAETDRHAAWLAAQPAEALPTVDVLIPTYNEGWDVLEKTIVGACALDYPRVSVHVLDDGARDWLREACHARGVHYVRRPDRAHAKAGNINHALGVTHGELILVLDADFVAQRDFLTRTVGFFRDPSIGVVQVPHHFFNDDPLQMNLRLHQRHADDQELFFRDIMPARDAWGVAFSCGSNSVTRRSAIEAVGGIPTASITEDILTSIVLLQRGWRTVYVNERLARGLAPEGLAAMFTQRARWARGGIQLLFLPEGPVRARGLSVMQRLFFLPLSWLVASPGLLIMLLGPLGFLWADLVAVERATGEELLRYQAPMLLAGLVAGQLLCTVRRSPLIGLAHQLFTAFRLAPAVLHSLVRPFAVGFKVTPKGKLAQGMQVDARAAVASTALIAATLVGILLNHLPDWERVPPDAFLTPSLLWGALNSIVLLMCLLMAFEFPRARAEERFVIDEVHAMVADGRRRTVRVLDLSLTGARVVAAGALPPVGAPVELHLSDVGPILGHVARHIGPDAAGVAFDEPSDPVRAYLIAKVFTHAYENHGRAPTGAPTWQVIARRLLGLRPAPRRPVAVAPADLRIPTGWTVAEAAPAGLRPRLDVPPGRAYPRLAAALDARAA